MGWKGVTAAVAAWAAALPLAGCGAGEGIEDRLRAVPGVLSVVEAESKVAGRRYFQIWFEQPVDHRDPAGQRFAQRLALHHADTASPFVLATTGYYLFEPQQPFMEPAALLGASQLFVEHRYFQPSRPYPTDWRWLDLEQAAADHHRVVEAFRGVYTGAWISTGKSKGGLAALVHRKFHPGDVAGTVVYGAPVTLGLEDWRYANFLSQVGTADCRKRLREIQRELLIRRDAMIHRMEEQAASMGIGFGLVGVVPAFEGNVVTLAFSFWQDEHVSSCDGLPGASASDDELWGFFDRVGRPLLSADPFLLAIEPYHWQAYTEIGTPGLDTAHLDDLLTAESEGVDNLPSVDVEPIFDAAPAEEVAAWLSERGDRILAVYGENDPWIAAAPKLAESPGVHELVVPSGNHASNIRALPAAARQTALDALEAWTGVKPDPYVTD